jgi:hypothetical protein
MRRVRSLFGVAAALTVTPLMALPAWADACVTAPVATYTVGGFSCSVDNVLFSNIHVTPLGNVTLGNFTPFTVGNENGLALNYGAAATATNTTADVLWTYTVSAINGASIVDAFAAFTGTISGTGVATLGEQLLNSAGTTIGSITLNAPNTSQTITFSPQSVLFATKDQQDFSGANGTALSSSLANGFSTVNVPGPIVGAGVPGLVAACIGLIGLGRRRRRAQT